jgi:hypothetical protein
MKDQYARAASRYNVMGTDLRFQFVGAHMRQELASSGSFLLDGWWGGAGRGAEVRPAPAHDVKTVLSLDTNCEGYAEFGGGRG